jgi:hypothetical protein
VPPEYSTILYVQAIILSCAIAIILFMTGELGAGLIAIAVAIGVGLLPIWIILKKELGVIKDNKEEMRKTIDFLQKLTRYQIYEKIAMISTAAGRVPVAEVHTELFKNQLLSDLRAVREVKSELTEQQNEELRLPERE